MSGGITSSEWEWEWALRQAQEPWERLTQEKSLWCVSDAVQSQIKRERNIAVTVGPAAHGIWEWEWALRQAQEPWKRLTQEKSLWCVSDAVQSQIKREKNIAVTVGPAAHGIWEWEWALRRAQEPWERLTHVINAEGMLPGTAGELPIAEGMLPGTAGAGLPEIHYLLNMILQHRRCGMIVLLCTMRLHLRVCRRKNIADIIY